MRDRHQRDHSAKGLRRLKTGGAMNSFGSGILTSYIHRSPSHFFENSIEDDGHSSYISGSAADPAPGYEEIGRAHV